MNLFMWLLLAHLLYDFHWQGDFIGLGKAKYWFLMWVHSATYALVLCGVLSVFGLFSYQAFFYFLISHFFIDTMKARGILDSLFSSKDAHLTYSLWIDQALHLVAIIVILVNSNSLFN